MIILELRMAIQRIFSELPPAAQHGIRGVGFSLLSSAIVFCLYHPSSADANAPLQERVVTQLGATGLATALAITAVAEFRAMCPNGHQ